MGSLSTTSLYMWSLIIMVAFFLLATLIANLINYKPQNPGTTARRVWFWVLCVLSGIVAFLVNFLKAHKIMAFMPAPVKSSYMTHSAVSAFVAIVAFIIIGFVISKIFSKSKVGTWFN